MCQTFPELDYQRQLIVANLDDFSPNAALPNYKGGQYGKNQDEWRKAVVDFLCLNFRCGLIAFTHRLHSDSNSCVEIENLLRYGDEQRSVPADIVWDVLYFNGTDKLKDIICRFNLGDWGAVGLEVNSGFIEKLREIYDSLG